MLSAPVIVVNPDKDDPSQYYGFLDYSEHGSRGLYFRQDRAHHIVCEDGTVRFGASLKNDRTARRPTKGEYLYFSIGRNHRGPMVELWGFEDEYLFASRQAGISPATLYRVVMIHQCDKRIVKTKEGAEYLVVCSPMTLGELQKRHPKPYSKNGYVADPFPERFSYGSDVHRFFFERETSAGVWEKCDDPREDPWKKIPLAW